MTVTEDAPVAAPASESTAPAPVPTGLAAILGSGDHEVVGRIWLTVSLLHLLFVGGATVLVSAERIDSSAFDVLGKDWIVRADTFQFISLVFLLLLPLTIAVATAVVPRQVGADTVAFPRAAAFAAWGYLLGGGLLIAAYAIHGGPDGTEKKGAVLFVVAFGLLVLSLLVAWICIATTVITLRTLGMRLIRVPLFSWSCLVAAGVWIMTLPVLLGLAILSYLDVRYDGFLGGGPGSVYGRISWVFIAPAVYALGIPVLGFVGSVVPVFFQTRHQQHRIALGLIGAFGALSVGAWTIPGLSGATPWLYKGPWVVVSITALVPLLGLVGLWALTARQGRLSFGSPVLFALVATLLLLLGVAAGAVQAIRPIKTIVDGPGTSLYGTSWTSAVLGILALAGITAMVGAVVYWAPRLVGHRVPEGGARVIAVLLLLGSVVTAVPELIAGLLGQPATATLAPAEHVVAIEKLELAATIGNGILILAGTLFILLLLKAATSRGATEEDPWSGQTLEWVTGPLPKISSEAPLYDARHHPEEVAVG